MDTIPSLADDHHRLTDGFVYDVLRNLKVIEQCFDPIGVESFSIYQ